jgi:hypothetical protein
LSALKRLAKAFVHLACVNEQAVEVAQCLLVARRLRVLFVHGNENAPRCVEQGVIGAADGVIEIAVFN